MKDTGILLTAAILTVCAASGCKSDSGKETPVPQGICAVREDTRPTVTDYYAERSSPAPNMLMFIGEGENIELLCGFGPQEKEWWHVVYNRAGVLQNAVMHNEAGRQVAVYERGMGGFRGGRLDDRTENISEAGMLEILGMKSPYWSEEVRLLGPVR